MTTIFVELIIGLGIFLYGMARLEAGLREVGGLRFKQWLMHSTATPLSSAGFGVVITTILQSSSMVSLLVLAFASAGMMPLYNGIGVLFGANVGTTATGWLVATLGFKLDLEQLAIPLFGIGCLSQVFVKKTQLLYGLGKLVLGLGLLLYGLSVMKGSVAELPQSWEAYFRGQSAFFYLVIGAVMTAIIQSSSAAMMLTLTLLNAGLISLPDAAAVVIGADMGTTSTTVMGSLTGSAIKKRLALAHVLFNVSVDLTAFIVLLPLLPLLVSWLSIDDSLYALVAFHSSFNLLGLLCFLPFLKPFSRWIERRFCHDQLDDQIENMPVMIPEAALSAMQNEVAGLWLIAQTNNLQHLDLPMSDLSVFNDIDPSMKAVLSECDDNWRTNYQHLKDKEDQLMRFSLRIQQQPLDEGQAGQLSQMLDITRSLVYASKTLKDIHENLALLKQSNQSGERDLFALQKDYHRKFYNRLFALMQGHYAEDYIKEELDSLTASNDQQHQMMDARVYSSNVAGETQWSTQLNVNREIHHANKSLLRSLSLWLRLKPLGSSTRLNS